MHPDVIDKLRKKAEELGASDFGYSSRKGKRFYVVYNDKTIHFGAKNGQTFIDHENEKKRKAWKARHIKIYNKNGPAYQDKESPEHWSWSLLW